MQYLPSAHLQTHITINELRIPFSANLYVESLLEICLCCCLSAALILLISVVDRIRIWRSMYDNRLLFTSISLDVTIKAIPRVQCRELQSFCAVRCRLSCLHGMRYMQRNIRYIYAKRTCFPNDPYIYVVYTV
jgi:hypothetical protein